MPLLAHSLTASRSHSPATNDHDKTNVLAVLGLNLVRIQDPGIRRAPPPSPGRAQAEAASAAESARAAKPREAASEELPPGEASPSPSADAEEARQGKAEARAEPNAPRAMLPLLAKAGGTVAGSEQLSAKS